MTLNWAKLNNNFTIGHTITQEESKSYSLPSLTEWKDESGWINKAMLSRRLSTDGLNNSLFCICGTAAILNAMQKLLPYQFGVPDEKIRMEEFTGY
jgi:Na+-transporting NADH:ubiquinone oxidoreductase subunit NqrF